MQKPINNFQRSKRGTLKATLKAGQWYKERSIKQRQAVEQVVALAMWHRLL